MCLYFEITYNRQRDSPLGVCLDIKTRCKKEPFRKFWPRSWFWRSWVASLDSQTQFLPFRTHIDSFVGLFAPSPFIPVSACVRVHFVCPNVSLSYNNITPGLLSSIYCTKLLKQTICEGALHACLVSARLTRRCLFHSGYAKIMHVVGSRAENLSQVWIKCQLQNDRTTLRLARLITSSVEHKFYLLFLICFKRRRFRWMHPAIFTTSTRAAL